MAYRFEELLKRVKAYLDTNLEQEDDTLNLMFSLPYMQPSAAAPVPENEFRREYSKTPKLSQFPENTKPLSTPHREDRPEYGESVNDAQSYPAEIDEVPETLVMPTAQPEPRFVPAESRFFLDESFAQAVLRLIDEKGMTDPQCYTRANLSRAVFNKLKQGALNPGNTEYRPSKETALALTMGLSLTLEEAKRLLEKAGFVLSHSSRRDLIVEYFLIQENHDIFELNEVLYRFGQTPLGSF